MFTIWTNPENVSNAQQSGYVGPDLPLSEWQVDSLAFVRPDGSAILF